MPVLRMVGRGRLTAKPKRLHYRPGRCARATLAVVTTAVAALQLQRCRRHTKLFSQNGIDLAQPPLAERARPTPYCSRFSLHV